MLKPSETQFGAPGKSGPAIFAFTIPKASAREFHPSNVPRLATPSWRSGSTHGFYVTGGHSPIASEPTPSPRLWATASGATPARLSQHIMGGSTGHSKPELSTLPRSGTFYFALTKSSWEVALR